MTYKTKWPNKFQFLFWIVPWQSDWLKYTQHTYNQYCLGIFLRISLQIFFFQATNTFINSSFISIIIGKSSNKLLGSTVLILQPAFYFVTFILLLFYPAFIFFIIFSLIFQPGFPGFLIPPVIIFFQFLRSKAFEKFIIQIQSPFQIYDHQL